MFGCFFDCWMQLKRVWVRAPNQECQILILPYWLYTCSNYFRYWVFSCAKVGVLAVRRRTVNKLHYLTSHTSGEYIYWVLVLKRPESEPALELHSRAVPSVEAHHHVHSPNTGRNSGGSQIIKNCIRYFIVVSLSVQFSWQVSVVTFSKTVKIK